MNNSVRRVTEAEIEAAFAGCLYTSDFRFALWNSVWDETTYGHAATEALHAIRVAQVRRFREIGGPQTDFERSRRFGLVVDLTTGDQFQILIGRTR